MSSLFKGGFQLRTTNLASTNGALRSLGGPGSNSALFVGSGKASPRCDLEEAKENAVLPRLLSLGSLGLSERNESRKE